MSYIHLTIEERASIAHLRNHGASLRQIAKAIGRNASTVKRELDRNFTPSANPKLNGASYFPHSSHRRYKKRISQAHNVIHLPKEIVQTIERRLRETWSPEQISAFYKGDGFPCHKTIYKWINDGTIIDGNKSLLRRKGKGGWYEKRGKATKGKSIRKRDKSVYKRGGIRPLGARHGRVGDGEIESVFHNPGRKEIEVLQSNKIPEPQRFGGRGSNHRLPKDAPARTGQDDHDGQWEGVRKLEGDGRGAWVRSLFLRHVLRLAKRVE